MGCCHSSSMAYIRPPAMIMLSTKANEELLEKIRFLRESPVFSRMHHDELPIIAAACNRKVFAQGDQVVRSGDPGREFYVIAEGKASMWMDSKTVEEDAGRRSSGLDDIQCGRQSVISSQSSVAGRLSRLLESLSSERSGAGDRQSPSSPSSGRPVRFSLASPTYQSEDENRTGGGASGTASRDIPSSPTSATSALGANGLWICTLRRMDYFGERSLAYGDGGRWDVSIVAESEELVCLHLTGERFRKLRLREKLRIPKRRIMPLMRASKNAKRENPIGARAATEKSDEQAQLLRESLLGCEALHGCLDLNDYLLQALVDIAFPYECKKDEEVLGPTSNPESCLLVVDSGRLRVAMAPMETVEDAHDKVGDMPSRRMLSLLGSSGTWLVPDDDLTRGSTYGAQTLLYDALHSAEVRALEDSMVWRIGSMDYVDACKRARELKRERYAELLGRVDAFSAMLSAERQDISRGVVEQEFAMGQAIYSQGSEGETFYILIDGEVSITVDGTEECKLLGSEEEPAAFGEHALAQPFAQPASTSIIVTSASARCMLVTRGMTLGRASMFADMGKSKSAAFLKRSSMKVRKEKLKKLATLGRGAFGFVELLQDPESKELYALKTMKKAKIARTDYMKKQVQNEKYILELTDSRFINKLHQTGRNDQDIFFLLEACLGGELYMVYINLDLFGKEEHARYYCASVACAFEHLHERCIIYRDLKPENLLLDEAGRLKVADMGLAKFVVGETCTVCGTPAYFPPEQAQHTGYTNTVDWWQLGILVWELLARKTPFMAQSRGEALYWLLEKNVLRGLDDPSRVWPQGITKGAKEFLRAVLCYEPSQRSAMLPRGTANSLRDNAWFKSFEWEKLEDGTLAVPFVPPPVNVSQLSNFNNQVTNACDTEVYVDDGTGWDEDFGRDLT